MRGETIATFTTREGLPDNTISQILEDRPALCGWANRGIVRASKRDLEDLAARKIPVVYPQILAALTACCPRNARVDFFPQG